MFQFNSKGDWSGRYRSADESLLNKKETGTHNGVKLSLLCKNKDGKINVLTHKSFLQSYSNGATTKILNVLPVPHEAGIS